MNNYDNVLDIYFKNLPNEIEQYINNPYNYEYGQSECYKDGFKEFYYLIQEKYSEKFRLAKKYEKMNGNRKIIDPYICLKFFDNKLLDGVYIYIKLPSEPNKKYLKLSLELGKRDRYYNDNEKYLLNLQKLYLFFKDNIEEYKNKLVYCSDITSLGNNNNLLEAYLYDFSKLDESLEIIIGLYMKIINNLNVSDWGDSWEKIQKDLFGESYVAINITDTSVDNELEKDLDGNINNDRFLELKESYLSHFNEYISEELYKWKAIKKFNDNWNLDVSNDEFKNMVKMSLESSSNILSSAYYYPFQMIVLFSEKDPNTVKEMFRYLFDETKSLYERIKYFVDRSDELLLKYYEEDKNHFQDMHVISTYLGFKYPEKYYLFKSSVDKEALRYLGIEIKDQDKIIELINYFDACNLVHEKIISDEKMINSIESVLDNDCYKLDNYHILTWDFLYYAGRVYLQKNNEKKITEEINIDDYNDQQEWLIPANPNFYDHETSFEKNGVIDWKQTVNYNVGDIVYLYITKPDQRITTKTIVTKVNINLQDAIDDSVFYKDPNFKKNATDKYVRLQRIEHYNNPRLRLDYLVKHGIKGAPQSAMHLPQELSDYIKKTITGEEMLSSNIIYYGGPGCGKSKLVDDTYCKDEEYYVRTTFYPDYTNSDFVGQLVPKYDKQKEKLEYIINPGPFTKALEKAYKNTDRNIYLIIEEINRGNAAAIFGDIFQLLDRNTESTDKPTGESTYTINNNLIEEYLGIENVKIPDNLSIIATMNTCDQNVYTLDSAFKRRWQMEYLNNEFDSEKTYDAKIRDKYVPMKKCDITWEDFIKTINEKIVSINTYGIHSEDKQIGKYFVGEFDLLDSKVDQYDDPSLAIKKFSEKVLMYLWEDVAKLDPKRWFDEDIKTFDKLLKKYNENGIDVFSFELKDALKEKEKSKVEKNDSSKEETGDLLENE